MTQLSMKGYFKNLKSDSLLIRLFIASFALLIVTFIYILINYSKLPPLLPVFNQLPWGERRLGETWGIFIPSVSVFLILIVNLFISNFSYPKFPLISRMFSVTTFIIALLSLLFVIRTITLII